MPAVQPNWLDPYIQNSKNRHKFYHDSCEMAEAINVHASGEFPDDLIKERRPAENKDIQKYRQKIYVPKTKPVFTKVYNSLQKIPRSPDYSIQFDQEAPARIPQEETLQRYITDAIPKYGSLSNWFWTVAFRYYLIDANAVVVTLPVNFDAPENEFYKPRPQVYTSEAILDYKEGEYYVIITSETERYEDEQNVSYNDGKRYMVIQPDVIQWFQYNPRTSKMIEIAQVVNEIGYLPVRNMRGLCIDEREGYSLYESRIAGMVPMLDEATREYSDLQAEVVQHIHSTMWTYQPQACKTCSGKGRVPVENAAPVQCPDCNGNGVAPMNPYEHLSVPMPKVGETPLSPPFMGYVEKNTAIAELQDTRVKQHIYDALASINMEYLAEVPLAQSGVAKQVDREELYSFVHSIASDCCRIIGEIITDACYWRYKPLGISDADLYAMLPEVIVPERFDLLSAGVLIEEITAMSNAKIDPAIINAAQIDLAEKRFANDPSVRDMVKLKLLLDPFAGVPEESIMLMKASGAVSQNDLVIHANINEFVNRAMQENKGFALLPVEKQREIMQGYATEKAQAMQTTMIQAEPAPAQ